MTAERLTAALIGCGRIGAWTADRLRDTLPPVWFPYSHLDALAEVDGVELVAVADADPAAAGRTAARFGAPRWYADGAELIERERPDLLLIATRMSGRAELIEVAVAHGVRGIHLEKPLAPTPAACRRVLDAAAAAGTRLSYGAVRRYMDVARTARRLVDDGRFGALRHVVSESRTAELLWAHPHTFDLFTYFVGTGPIGSVQARMRVPDGAFDGAVLDADPLVELVSVRYASGVTATVIDTGVGETRLVGERGEWVLGGNMAWLAEIDRTVPGRIGAPQPVEFEATASGRLRALAELAGAVRTGGDTSHTADDMWRTNQIGFAAAWSAVNGGRAVTPDEVPGDFAVTGRIGDLYA